MKELKPRERVERVLRHEPVDRVPLFYRFKHEAKEKLARVYGIEDAPQGVPTIPTSSSGSVTTSSFTRSASTPTSPTAILKLVKLGITTSALAMGKVAYRAAPRRNKLNLPRPRNSGGPQR